MQDLDDDDESTFISYRAVHDVRTSTADTIPPPAHVANENPRDVIIRDTS